MEVHDRKKGVAIYSFFIADLPYGLIPEAAVYSETGYDAQQLEVPAYHIVQSVRLKANSVHHILILCKGMKKIGMSSHDNPLARHRFHGTFREYRLHRHRFANHFRRNHLPFQRKRPRPNGHLQRHLAEYRRLRQLNHAPSDRPLLPERRFRTRNCPFALPEPRKHLRLPAHRRHEMANDRSIVRLQGRKIKQYRLENARTPLQIPPFRPSERRLHTHNRQHNEEISRRISTKTAETPSEKPA